MCSFHVSALNVLTDNLSALLHAHNRMTVTAQTIEAPA